MNNLGHALVFWTYRAPSGRIVRILQWHPTDTTPKAILRRQAAGLPYEKYCLIIVHAKGAEYANLQPPAAANDRQLAYYAGLAQKHVDLCAQCE